METTNPLLKLVVKAPGEIDVKFTVKGVTPLLKVFEAYCHKVGVDIKSITFSFNGINLTSGKTPYSLNMKTNSIINAHIKRKALTNDGSNISLHLLIKSDESRPYSFKVPSTTGLARVMSAYASRIGVNQETLQFLYKGKYLKPTQTAASLFMQNNDEIIVMRKINIIVWSQNGRRISFKIHKTTQFSMIINAYCKMLNLDKKTAHLCIDGKVIQMDQTPSNIDLKDGSLLEAVFDQQNQLLGKEENMDEYNQIAFLDQDDPPTPPPTKYDPPTPPHPGEKSFEGTRESEGIPVPGAIIKESSKISGSSLFKEITPIQNGVSAGGEAPNPYLQYFASETSIKEPASNAIQSKSIYNQDSKKIDILEEKKMLAKKKNTRRKKETRETYDEIERKKKKIFKKKKTVKEKENNCQTNIESIELKKEKEHLTEKKKITKDQENKNQIIPQHLAKEKITTQEKTNIELKKLKEKNKNLSEKKKNNKGRRK